MKTYFNFNYSNTFKPVGEKMKLTSFAVVFHVRVKLTAEQDRKEVEVMSIGD